MLVLLFFAFASGLVAIFAPCVWPLLPIVLSATSTGGRAKPFGIAFGLVVSFTLVTLLLTSIIRVIPIGPDLLRYLAVGVVALLGLFLVIPALGHRLEAVVSRLSNRLGGATRGTSGLNGGFVTGAVLGFIWTPCAGPILATVAALAATQQVSWQVALVTFVFALGVAVPLFAFATAGNWLFTKSRLLNRYTGRIQRAFGLIMLVTAIGIGLGYDRVLQAKFLDAFPGYTDFIIRFESSQIITDQLEQLKR